MIYDAIKGDGFVAQVTLNVNVDESDKHQFCIICSEAGLNASDAINLFVKAVIRERRMPFEIADGMVS
jgi:DNA-damage-inducible protein J